MVKSWAQRVRDWFIGLGRAAKVLVLSTAVGVLLVTGYVGWQASKESYAPLFSQLERDDAAALVAKLKELKVNYKLTNDGTTIEVPEAKVHDVRLELASSGLPRGGGIGFESFDKMRLGATEFEQRVLYRRALEGELSRTISAVSAVQSTRVHLVLPEKSVFVSRSEPASASIVVKLKAAHSLTPHEISAIVHLASSAVPGLQAERVALVTTEGTMLHRPKNVSGGELGGGAGALGGGAGGDDQLTPSQLVERDLEERARSMLERLLGAGHVDVRVSAEVDLSRVEHVEDHYDPQRMAVRSEVRTVERVGSLEETPASAVPPAGVVAVAPPGQPTAAGVPGAESNLPTERPGALSTTARAPVPSALPSASASAVASAAPSVAPPRGYLPVRESYTRNWEIDHVSEKRVTTQGALKRIAVAVAVDGITRVEDGKSVTNPRSKEELDKIAALVRGAVGANLQRGDVVTVECVPFAATELGDGPAPATVAPATTITALIGRVPQQHRKWVYIAAGVLTLLLFGTLARLLRPRRAPAPAPEPEIALLSSAAREMAALPPSVSEADLREEAVARARKDPATAALVLRYWLGTSLEQAAEEGAQAQLTAKSA